VYSCMSRLARSGSSCLFSGPPRLWLCSAPRPRACHAGIWLCAMRSIAIYDIQPSDDVMSHQQYLCTPMPDHTQAGDTHLRACCLPLHGLSWLERALCRRSSPLRLCARPCPCAQRPCHHARPMSSHVYHVCALFAVCGAPFYALSTPVLSLS
jgi:hypothetical protein